MKAILTLYLLLTATYGFSVTSYKVALAPFKKYPEYYGRYTELQERFSTSPLSIDEHKERIKILAAVINREPHWIDGYWLLASESFILGSSISDPDNPAALKALTHGKSYTDKCLKIDPHQILCKFFRASLMAKIASIHGIFASLRHGQEIHDIWQEVSKSSINFNFRPNVSLIGSAYYGLGIFYRLVPDNFLIEWFWGIRGNKDTSIALHRKAIQYDQGNPCSMLMLSVALLCRHGTSREKPEVREAYKIIDKIHTITPIDIPQAVCKNDTKTILRNPKKTCGYTQAKYQEDEPIPTK